MTNDKPLGEVVENKIIIWDKEEANNVYDNGNYGKITDEGHNELSLIEGIYLLEKDKIDVKNNAKKITRKQLYKLASEKDDELPWKYSAYKDLRDRGLLVKTGFKFGTHFRVYERGVKLKRGPKETREHTKWIVHAIPTDFTCSLPELSRAVRLAHNIRARMLWAVVDEERDVTYYEVQRVKP